MSVVSIPQTNYSGLYLTKAPINRTNVLENFGCSFVYDIDLHLNFLCMLDSILLMR